MIDVVTIYDKLKAMQKGIQEKRAGVWAESAGDMADLDYWTAIQYEKDIEALLKEIAAAIVPAKIERRHVVTLELQGDTWDEVTNALAIVVKELQAEGPPRNITSGAPGAGFILLTHENKDQTHERYMEQVREFLAEHGLR